MADAPKLQGTEKIGESYYKINMGIDNANEALNRSIKAESSSNTAVNISNNAKSKADSVQEQLNQVVINGDSSVEAAQARDSLDGTKHKVLNDRLNYMESGNPETGIVAFTFDDGFIEDRLTYSIYKEYGIPCTFAPIMDRVFERNYIDYYRSYQANGFTIMSHSCNHKDMTSENMSMQEADYEVRGSAEGFAKYGLNVNGFVTPDARLNDKYLDLVKENYDYAVTRHIGFFDDVANGNLKKSDDPYKLYRWSLVWNPIDKIKKAIDNCIKERGLLLFYDHRTGAGTGHVDEAKLRQILDYVKLKVDSKQCRALNMNDAISSFFGKPLLDKTKGAISRNVAPTLYDTATSLTQGKWVFSNHANSIGETYKPITENGEEIGVVEYPVTIPKDKANSFQTRVDLTNVDMNNITNQNVCLEFDIWCDGDISNTKFTLESRFFAKDGTFDGIHVQKIEVGNKRRTFSFTSTPFKKLDFSHIMMYWRFDALAEIPVPFKIKTGKPMISFGAPVADAPKTSLLDGSNEMRLGLDAEGLTVGTIWPRQSWVKYFITPFENAYIKSLSDATFEVKKSGLYNINFNGHYDVVGGGDSNSFCRMIVDIGKTGFAPNGQERNTQYYRPPDDRFSVNVTNTIYCEKGERLYIKGFYDDKAGSLKEYREKPTVRITCVR